MRVAVAVALTLSAVTSARARSPTDLPLLPAPASVMMADGAFSVSHARIAAEGPGARDAARRVQSLLRRSGGPELRFARRGEIQFHIDAAVAGTEAYHLRVTRGKIDVTASTATGLYYGAETLWQLLASASERGEIPALDISDRPAFSWRGVMLDSARHMQPVSYIEELIDRMAMAKLNTLQWHLTDDQGWRIQIDRYPRLTSVGAWREEAGAEGFDPETGKLVRYGGYYTKAEIRTVVAYARKRHITIVPEIEMPGHATAMIAAYPELASVPKPPKTPSNNWGILPNLLTPADTSFAFIENVLDEVMPLFPGQFVHVGGDEAVKEQWKSNPIAQARIKALGLRDEDALQGWFTARIGAYLHDHGKRLIGWDEIMQGNVPADAAITSWHGPDGAIAAAKSGHDAVLAPAPDLYLDFRQSDSASEPPGRGELVSWKRLYDFKPVPTSLTAEERRHILGLQANLWSEYVRNSQNADRMIWPRAAVLAELAWSNAAKDWPSFSVRLIAAMERWRKLGLQADMVPLEPEPTFTLAGDAVRVALRQPAAIGTIHYSLNGAPLSSASAIYSKPLTLAAGTALATQSFLGSTPLGRREDWKISAQLALTRTASGLELCWNAIPVRLGDDTSHDRSGKVHWVDLIHPCWIWRAAPLGGVRRVLAEVARKPFNFAIGDDAKKVSFRQPSTPAGELQVRRDSCNGPLIANIPLEPAAQRPGETVISGQISSQDGAHDLCMTFTQKRIDPFWVLDRLTLQ